MNPYIESLQKTIDRMEGMTLIEWSEFWGRTWSLDWTRNIVLPGHGESRLELWNNRCIVNNRKMYSLHSEGTFHREIAFDMFNSPIRLGRWTLKHLKELLHESMLMESLRFVQIGFTNYEIGGLKVWHKNAYGRMTTFVSFNEGRHRGYTCVMRKALVTFIMDELTLEETMMLPSTLRDMVIS